MTTVHHSSTLGRFGRRFQIRGNVAVRRVRRAGVVTVASNVGRSLQAESRVQLIGLKSFGSLDFDFFLDFATLI
jgi:hypothetical protein